MVEYIEPVAVTYWPFLLTGFIIGLAVTAVCIGAMLIAAKMYGMDGRNLILAAIAPGAVGICVGLASAQVTDVNAYDEAKAKFCEEVSAAYDVDLTVSQGDWGGNACGYLAYPTKEPASAFHVYGDATVHRATDIGQFETLDVSLVWQDGAFYLATPDGGSPAEYTMLDAKVHPVDTAR